MPSDDVYLKCLELEWQDHFQTRTQTWRSLEMEALLAVALVGIDWKLENILATSAVAVLLIVAALFGTLITLHHRNGVERRKFKHIIKIEEILGLRQPGGLYEKVKVPEVMKWTEAFSLELQHRSTSHFILRVHLILMVFGGIYLVFRLAQYSAGLGLLVAIILIAAASVAYLVSRRAQPATEEE